MYFYKGLCGNFNYNENDDLKTSSGILQNDVVDFVNTWKTQYQCQNVVPDYQHPCLYNMEIGNNVLFSVTLYNPVKDFTEYKCN